MERNTGNSTKLLSMNGIVDAMREYIKKTTYHETYEQFILKANYEEYNVDKDALDLLLKFIEDTLKEALKYAVERGASHGAESIDTRDMDMAIDITKRNI